MLSTLAANLVCQGNGTSRHSCPGATVYVRTTQPDDVDREITAKGYRFMRPGIERTPWRSKLMEVTDPFNNRLRFDELLASSA